MHLLTILEDLQCLRKISNNVIITDTFTSRPWGINEINTYKKKDKSAIEVF